MRRLALSACVLAGLASLGWHMPLVAQDDESNVLIDEIIVTARRVEENLQDVPLAISAFSAEVIEQAGISSLDDIAMHTPGLTYSSLLGDILATPVIRGMAPLSALGEDNNAAMFVDGIFVSGRKGLTFSMLDLERIEVVKGPQTAMYGRDAFSGAINFVTARPTDEIQGKVELTAGGDGLFKAIASLSGPLVANILSGRIAVSTDDFDGTYANAMVGGPDNIGGHESKTFHGSLYYTPGNMFEADATFYYSDDHIGPPSMQVIAPNCEDQDPGPGVNLGNYCGKLPAVGKNDLAVVPGAYGQERELTRTTLSLAWNAEFGTITSLSGYSRVKTDYAFEGAPGIGDSVPYAYVSNIFGAAGPFDVGPLSTFTSALITLTPAEENSEVSTELRFTSPEDRSFRYSVGAYIFSREFDEAEGGEYMTTPVPDDFAAFCPCIDFGGVGFAIPVGNAVFGPWFQPGGNVGYGPGAKSETDSWSLFAYAEKDFADSWKARLEARFSDEEKTVRDLIAGETDKANWDFVTWRAGLDWHVNDDLMVYGSVAGAQKAGDIDTTIVNGVVQISGLDPEKTTAIELGMKGTFLGGRMQADAAVYHTDWEDIVLQTIREDANGQPFGVRVNAGDARIMGIEANLSFAFNEHLSGTLGATFTDPELTTGALSSFDDLPSFAPNGDVSGNELHRQSRIQANASLTYRNAFLGGDSEWYWRADVLHQGKQWVHVTNQGEIPARTITNLRIGFERKALSVELWSTNLFDDDSPIAAYRSIYFSNAWPDGSFDFFNSFFSRNTQVTHPQRRLVGVTARLRF